MLLISMLHLQSQCTTSSTRTASVLHKYLDDVFHAFMTFGYILVTLFLFMHSLYDMSSQSHITETNLLTPQTLNTTPLGDGGEILSSSGQVLSFHAMILLPVL